MFYLIFLRIIHTILNSKRKKHKKDDGSSKRSKPEVDEDIVSHGMYVAKIQNS